MTASSPANHHRVRDRNQHRRAAGERSLTLHPPAARLRLRPVRELKGFQRVTLAAGESGTVTFPLGPGERRYWNAAARDWVIDTTTIDVFAGGDSPPP